MKKRMSRLAALSLGLAMMLTACGGGGGSATPTPAPSQAPEQSEAPTQSAAPQQSEAPTGGKIGEGRTLVVGVWGAEQETLVREHVVKPFEEETGAKVELILGGSGDRYSKLYAEVDNPSMDVMYLNMAQTEQATRDGMILPADPEGVANYNNLYDIAKCGDGYGVALMATGLMYNTDPHELGGCPLRRVQGPGLPLLHAQQSGFRFPGHAGHRSGGQQECRRRPGGAGRRQALPPDHRRDS